MAVGWMGGTDPRRTRATLLTALPLALACVAFAACANPYADIVSRIEAAQAPLILRISHSEVNLGGQVERPTIFLASDVTNDEAAEAWCEVIVAAGAGQLPADRVNLRRAGAGQLPNDWLQLSRPLEKPACP